MRAVSAGGVSTSIGIGVGSHPPVVSLSASCSRLDRLDFGASDLVEEFVAESDFVLKSAPEGRLICIARAPNPRLAHEPEPSTTHHGGTFSFHVCSEEH